MRAFRYSKTWIVLAMLAMFSIAAAPAFALSCCCHETQQTTHSVTPDISAPVAAQSDGLLPSCHAHHADTHGAASRPLSQDALQSSVSGPCIQQVCQCEVTDTPMVVVPETAKTSTQFAALALPSAPFAIPSPDAPARHFNAQGPSYLLSRTLPSISGRAPPAI
jgi:hypothetical protein